MQAQLQSAKQLQGSFLANGGQLDGIRILGPRTVRLMMRDHLPSSFGPNPLADLIGGDINVSDRGIGFGFTGLVVVNAAHHPIPPISQGSFSWSGSAHTVSWVDPKEEMVVIALSQVMISAKELNQRMASLAHQAIVD